MNLSPRRKQVNKLYKGFPTTLLLLAVIESIDEVLELRTAELAGANAEDEADGVHEVGFSSAIRTDYGGEVEEGADHLVAFVGFEVLEFETVDLTGRG